MAWLSWLPSLLIGLFGGLCAIIGFLCKQQLQDLKEAVRDLRVSSEASHADVREKLGMHRERLASNSARLDAHDERIGGCEKRIEKLEER